MSLASTSAAGNNSSPSKTVSGSGLPAVSSSRDHHPSSNSMHTDGMLSVSSMHQQDHGVSTVDTTTTCSTVASLGGLLPVPTHSTSSNSPSRNSSKRRNSIDSVASSNSGANGSGAPANS
ncbi:unnamed protein product, partial [Amoebophrya sp. A25]|eukprot:GSA25T00021207001.1